MTYTVTLSNGTDLTVEPTVRDIELYGLVQAIIEATHKHPIYNAERIEFEVGVRTIWIDDEAVTQF